MKITTSKIEMELKMGLCLMKKTQLLQRSSYWKNIPTNSQSKKIEGSKNEKNFDAS